MSSIQFRPSVPLSLPVSQSVCVFPFHRISSDPLSGSCCCCYARSNVRQRRGVSSASLVREKRRGGNEINRISARIHCLFRCVSVILVSLDRGSVSRFACKTHHSSNSGICLCPSSSITEQPELLLPDKHLQTVRDVFACFGGKHESSNDEEEETRRSRVRHSHINPQSVKYGRRRRYFLIPSSRLSASSQDPGPKGGLERKYSTTGLFSPHSSCVIIKEPTLASTHRQEQKIRLPLSRRHEDPVHIIISSFAFGYRIIVVVVSS